MAGIVVQQGCEHAMPVASARRAYSKYNAPLNSCRSKSWAHVFESRSLHVEDDYSTRPAPKICITLSVHDRRVGVLVSSHQLKHNLEYAYHLRRQQKPKPNWNWMPPFHVRGNRGAYRSDLDDPSTVSRLGSRFPRSAIVAVGYQDSGR